jgi:hypothetical protein
MSRQSPASMKIKCLTQGRSIKRKNGGRSGLPDLITRGGRARLSRKIFRMEGDGRPTYPESEWSHFSGSFGAILATITRTRLRRYARSEIGQTVSSSPVGEQTDASDDVDVVEGLPTVDPPRCALAGIPPLHEAHSRCSRSSFAAR